MAEGSLGLGGGKAPNTLMGKLLTKFALEGTPHPLFNTVMTLLPIRAPELVNTFIDGYTRSPFPEMFAQNYLTVLQTPPALTNAQMRRLDKRLKQQTRFGSVNSRNALTYNRKTPSWLHHHNARYPAGRRLWTPNLAENMPPQLPTSQAAVNQATALRQELYPPHVIHNPENENERGRKRKNQKTRKNRR
jgi:hypothetical protein